jgi:hypothetical protein
MFIRGGNSMTEITPRTFYYGNSKVVIHSKLVWMTSEERVEWFRREWEVGNPVLHQIAAVLFEEGEKDESWQNLQQRA